MYQCLIIFDCWLKMPLCLGALLVAAVGRHSALQLASPSGGFSRTAALCTEPMACLVKHVFCAGWTFFSSTQRDCHDCWSEFVQHFLSSASPTSDLSPVLERIRNLGMEYPGHGLFAIWICKRSSRLLTS